MRYVYFLLVWLGFFWLGTIAISLIGGVGSLELAAILIVSGLGAGYLTLRRKASAAP